MSLLAQHAAMMGRRAAGWNSVVASLPALWAWWRLDETADFGVTASDASGNGRHGTYSASGTQTTGLFTGSTAAQATLGGRVAMPVYTTAATPKFTVGACIRTTAGAGEQQIIACESTTGDRIFQFRKHPSTHQLEFITITPSVTSTAGATAINDGDPHLVIAVFDQSLDAEDGRVKLYLDGELDGTSTTSITIGAALSRAVAIGSRRADLNQGLWAGAIDECFLCHDAIAAADVSALWESRNILDA